MQPQLRFRVYSTKSLQPMTLDLTGINTKVGFHHLAKTELPFPDWYGVSWDAFWDCIIAAARDEMPLQVTITNWTEFAEACPRDMQILREIIADYNEEMAHKHMELA
jgi:RNAse (barnase) inhibitor barstar